MTVQPVPLTDRPNQRAAAVRDPLSDVLQTLRLSGGVFLDARFTAPWSVTAHMTREDCAAFLPVPNRVIAFHVVLEGRLRLGLCGAPPVELRAGEVVLFPRNDPHVLASADGLPPIPASTLIRPSPDGGLARIDHGGGGAPTRLVCGFLGSDSDEHPLLACLPRLLRLDVSETSSRDWIEASMRFAAGECAAGRHGASGMLSRLSELLLVEAVRRYAATRPEDHGGWLRGLRDPQIGRAIALIHRDSTSAWTAASLAREVALSRSAFVERFTRLVGLPPIRYLTVWRLQLARQALGETDHSLARIAHQVGYESEEAFSRAFKRAFGLAPGRWRDQRAAQH